ncbi:MAG: RNA-directed DNA polymerase [Candidatus Pacebacteria bacterium]|nr:RNA-directed DNA polymerase [Candidatus Paceibacterota bacterium]
MGAMEKKIKDEKTMRLIKEITGSFNKETKTGIPIGNLTSQLFANIFLGQMDQFIKRELKQKHFIRYMDDFLILGEKKELHYLKEKIRNYLELNLKLELHPKKADISPLFKGVDFLGYVAFKNHVLLRKSTVKRFLKKTKKVGGGRTNAWLAYAKHADAFGLTKAVFKH